MRLLAPPSLDGQQKENAGVETADAAEASHGFHMDATRRQMLIIAASSLILLAALTIQGELLPTAAFLAPWIASPWLMQWLGAEGGVFVRRGLDEEDSAYLQKLARRTWRYFDDLLRRERTGFLRIIHNSPSGSK